MVAFVSVRRTQPWETGVPRPGWSEPWMLWRRHQCLLCAKSGTSTPFFLPQSHNVTTSKGYLFLASSLSYSHLVGYLLYLMASAILL